jgi:hypothetical protein
LKPIRIHNTDTKPTHTVGGSVLYKNAHLVRLSLSSVVKNHPAADPTTTSAGGKISEFSPEGSSTPKGRGWAGRPVPETDSEEEMLPPAQGPSVIASESSESEEEEEDSKSPQLSNSFSDEDGEDFQAQV